MTRKKLTVAQKIRKQKVAENLTYYMTLRGISGRDLANKTNISVQTISAVRHGRGKLSAESAEKLASVLHCEPDDIDPGYKVTIIVDTPENSFSTNLNTQMIKHNEKVADLAKAIGYAEATVSKWKNNKLFPSDSALYKLAQHYQVNPQQLLGKDYTSELLPNLTPLQQEVLSHLPKQLSEKNLAKLIKYIDSIASIDKLENSK